MQVTETKTEGLKREFKIAVPAAEIEKNVTERLVELARTVRMPGFRPGKVPVSLLRKKYGSSVMGEVVERTVNDSSRKIMSEREIRPAAQPEIEVTSFDDGSDLEYTMAVELLPEIEPIDFSTIKLERMVVAVADAEVDKALERIAEAHKTSEPVSADRVAEAGDIAVIDFTGRVDGEEFPGGKAEDYSLELGSESFIPGFEDQIVGVRAGAKITVNVTFPESYGAAELAGKDAVFDVTVKELRETRPMPVDDELAKKMGMDDLEALRKSIIEEHEREYRQISRLRIKRGLLDALADRHDFVVPDGLLEREFDTIWKQYEEQKEKAADSDSDADSDVDSDAKSDAKSDDEQKTEFRTIAKRRVRLGLVLADVGRRGNLEVSQEDINRAMMAEARRYPGQEQAVMDHYRKSPEAMESLTAPIYEEKVVDYILEMADVSEVSVSAEELMKEPEDEESKPAAKSRGKSKAGKKTAPGKKAAKGK